MHLDGEAPIRRRDEDTAPDPDRLGHELPLALASADVLDDGVRKDDVELAVGEGQRARIALHVWNLWVTGTEAGAVVEAERRDPIGRGVQLVEEEPKLALARAEGDGVDESHRRKYPVSRGR